LVIVRIRLLDPEMLGRRFQYAFLSFANRVEVRPDLGEAIFPSEDEYVSTVEAALDAIIRALSWPENAKKKSKCPDYEIDCDGTIKCTSLDRGPNLYQAGKKSDRRTLKAAGLTTCKYYTSKCDEGVAWVHAAVSYACMVLSRGGPLGGGARYDIPWLARATLFSKIRSVRGTSEARTKTIDIDTLGTVLLGGALSYLGRHRLGDSDIEFYVLPDYVSEAYRALREIAALDGITGNLAARVANTVKNLGAGFEQALALATATLASKHEARAQEMGVDVNEALASGKLYTIQSGQRVQVRAGVPLPNALLKAYTPETLKALDWFIDESLKARGDAKSHVKNAAVTCLNAMFLQAISSGVGELYIKDCMRVLAALLDQETLPKKTKEAARNLLRKLEWEAVRAIHRGSTL